jgi:hypothetical protein
MKTRFILLTCLFLVGCSGQTIKSPVESIEGTWKLLSGMIIDKGDTTVTNYKGNVSFIKILNKTHFAFLQHDLNKGVDSNAIYVSGGGRYSLTGNDYTEQLEYCSARNWEGNDFRFKISIRGDTLIQTGIEKVENLGIERLNIEKYVRIQVPPTSN